MNSPSAAWPMIDWAYCMDARQKSLQINQKADWKNNGVEDTQWLTFHIHVTGRRDSSQ